MKKENLISGLLLVIPALLSVMYLMPSGLIKAALGLPLTLVLLFLVNSLLSDEIDLA